MAEARQRDEWDRCSAVVAMVHNVNCTKRSDMRPPASFNPLRKGRPKAEMVVPISALKQRFLKAGFKEQTGKVQAQEVAGG